MSQQQQKQRDQAATQAGSQPTPAPQTAVATGHLEEMEADLKKIKKNDQLLQDVIKGMAQNPALSGGDKAALVLIENIKQQSGE